MIKNVESDIPRVKDLLCKVLGTSDSKRIERLGGLTNHTYKVVTDNDQTYVIRLPGEGTEKLINRADEKISTKLACDLDIDAELLYFGDEGEKVSRYIDGAKTMSVDAFQNADIVCKAAAVLRALHTCGIDTGVAFDVFDMAAGYETIIRDHAVAFFEDYDAVKMQVMRIRNYINQSEIAKVPCHNDPLCENWVLGESGKLYLIDWEYAGMNDGMWDLADVSIEASFTEEQDELFMKYYFGREPEQIERIRFHANKLYLDFLWALWGKARVPFDGESMERYGMERYERLKQNAAAFLVRYPMEEWQQLQRF